MIKNIMWTSKIIWQTVVSEAQTLIERETDLVKFIRLNVLNHKNLIDVIFYRLACLLEHSDLNHMMLTKVFHDTVPHILNYEATLAEDLKAVFELDPACHRLIEPILYFKGFQALQSYRLAHALWLLNRKDFAYFLQSRSSSVFQADIHPAAKIGQGIFIDHATGLVIGETATIEDNVSLLHSVTLGGSGKKIGARHPTIRSGVLIGAGAKILGNIEVGRCSKIAAGSVVLKDVPAGVTVAGVPAKIVGQLGNVEPARAMDQSLMLGDGI